MNNLVLTKKRVLKAEKLHKAQLATFKKGVFTSYKPSVFEEKQIVGPENNYRLKPLLKNQLRKLPPIKGVLEDSKELIA